MQLSTLEFSGYRRLNGTRCNVDGPAVAFIGPNESGKSSVLQGLEWLTDPRSRPLTLSEQNRRARPAPLTLVVRTRYRIDDEDVAALRDLDIDPMPPIDRKSVTEFRFSRRPDGTPVTAIETTVRRNPKPFHAAAAAIESLMRAVGKLPPRIEGDEAQHLVDSLVRLLDDVDLTNGEWDETCSSRLESHRRELEVALAEIESVDESWTRLKRIGAALDKLFTRMTDARDAGRKEDPSDAMRGALVRRMPRFVLFKDEDRDLAADYALSDEALRDDPPAPLRNLLTIAGTSVDELWTALAGGEVAELRTLQARLNAMLRSRLAPMWTQSQLTVELTLNQGGQLEVNVQEIDSPDYTVTPIAERSDGLRTFLGLVCFLIAQQLDRPPVLMIDEAERNLHYDAQADLVRVLTRELSVHKVLYTTHSPGCLPLDLGTGIRVVKRDPGDSGVSTLENTFWTESEPGFSHLLFAMGAEAAAFSAFRRAVLAEGVSEMILLPTLLRNASDGTQLDFQVAFGLSNMSAPSVVGSVALITTFLVDGDAAGDKKRAELLAAGFPRSHVFQLPKGKALEDLVDRSTYIGVVNDLLAETGESIPIGQLPSGVTVARAVDDYARAHLQRPDGLSHKIIASRLAHLGDDLRLSQSGRQYLSRLRSELEAAFASPYRVG